MTESLHKIECRRNFTEIKFDEKKSHISRSHLYMFIVYEIYDNTIIMIFTIMVPSMQYFIFG